jgi:thiol-disulfide isomerase/thioredoxin
MLRRSPIALALIVVTALTTPALAFRHLAAGQRIGPLSLPGPGAETIHFGAEAQGRATLVLFWATWSPRSLKALSDLEALHREFAPSGLRVVAVNVEGERPSAQDAARVTAAAQASGITYSVALDRDLSLYSAWGVGAVPSAALVDATGTILETMDGYPPGLSGRLGKLVAAALGAADARPAAAASERPVIASRTQQQSNEVSR